MDTYRIYNYHYSFWQLMIDRTVQYIPAYIAEATNKSMSEIL